ncbi:respiratory chain complex I subunit 1 family protein [Pyrococcus yayanosii]|uniref:Formate hydrogenlyase II subunit E n=1 Tax=Pyrococcus yayanosii (strain CH1 / JCM 16557) TaxID=529709 RepID=F8AEV6_PYRYC|nr:NADH-quinone oxidoreductase subunit H [Pyrococcus yayanosii]AEH24789.1 formate hydrogenlyase II subunit E [Pyrococcus yayanosii CH1]
MIEKAIFGISSLLIILALPPLLDGISRKIKATIQERQGPPILQTYYDLASLLSMEPTLPTDRLGFILAPYVALAAVISAGMLLPYGNFTPIAFSGDIFVFVYVLGIFSVSLMMAGFLVNNTYANAGANREMMLILGVEPILGIAVGIMALKEGTLSISGLAFNLTPNLAMLLILAFLGYWSYVECAFIPFDIAEAETEILEGPLVEYSGRLLGLFKWALLAKRVVLTWFFASMLSIPILKNYVDVSTLIGGVVIFIVQLALLIILYALSAVIEATTARMKVIQALRQNTIIFVIGLILLVLASLGVGM